MDRVKQVTREIFGVFREQAAPAPSSFSLIPQGDNSLLLINSGMAPMKKYFTGEVEPPRRRVTTCQKCIRTGDIENVGYTDRHGTYFEMLGNFSFGDYFKREAISFAWEFFTQVLEMPKEKLYISVYENDDEAWDIWTKEIGVEESHMKRPGQGGQLLGARLRPLRPLLGNLLRPGREARLRQAHLRRGLRLRPLCGSVEPGVFPV